MRRDRNLDKRLPNKRIFRFLEKDCCHLRRQACAVSWQIVAQPSDYEGTISSLRNNATSGRCQQRWQCAFGAKILIELQLGTMDSSVGSILRSALGISNSLQTVCAFFARFCVGTCFAKSTLLT
jgi:hypothetical protein